MARTKKLELSWIGALSQWRKRRLVEGKTKTFYLGTGESKNDHESYQRALSKWKAIEAELDAADAAVRAVAMRDAVIAKFEGAKQGIHSTTSSTPAISISTIKAAIRKSHDDNGNLKAPPAKIVASKKINKFVEEYVNEQERRWKHGDKFPDAPAKDRIGAARYIAYRNCAVPLKASWEGEDLPQNEQGLQVLIKKYRTEQQALLTESQIAPATFNERIKTMRHFLGWAFDNYHIQALPRKLDELCARYKVEVSARAVSLETIRSIWGAANERCRAYIALALNCGFYAIDVASLKRSDIKGGHIYYDRHKTGVPGRFKMWRVTKKLLEKTSNGKELVFEDAKGFPVVRIDPTKSGFRQSHVDGALYAVKKRLKIKGVSFSNFRDTSTTKIESIDRNLSDLFDAHKDQRMARFYIDKDHMDYDRIFAPLDRATDELEKWYALSL